MKRSALSRALVLICGAALTHFPASAVACTACMGDVNSKMAPAMNAAIFLMLGFIGSMLAGAAGFGFYLMKRANAPVPPHVEFTQAGPRQDDDIS